MERHKRKIETKVEAAERKQERLFNLLGIEESEEDQKQVTEAIARIRSEIEKSPTVGRSIESAKPDRKEFVIPVISAEHREALLESLYELGIFPWEENGLLIVDHKKDLSKLESAGVIRSMEYKLAPAEAPNVEHIDTESDLFAYRLPKQIKEPPSHKTSRSLHIKPEEDTSIDPGIDTELQDIISKFDAGVLDDSDEEFKATYGDMPTLTLFPHKYLWKGKKLSHARTGEIISREEQEKVLEKAHEGDARAMNETVRMHTGLVIYIARRIHERFGGDIDEIFQGGLLGLEYAIRNFSSDREDSNFVAYAASCIEGTARRNRHTGGPISQTAYHSGRRKDVLINDKKEQKANQLRGPKYGTEEEDSRAYNLAKLKQRLLIGAKYDPIEDHFDEEAWNQIDARGNDRFESPKQEASFEYFEMRDMLLEALSSMSPRERLILAARFGIAQPFMAPEETRPYLVGRGVEFDENDRVTNLHDMEKIDLFVLYISNYLEALPEGDFENGFTLESVGEFLQVTRERIRGIEAKALRRMKHPSRSAGLRPYLDHSDFATIDTTSKDAENRSADEVRKTIEDIRSRLDLEKQVAPEGWKTHKDVIAGLPSMNSFWRLETKLRKTRPELFQRYTNRSGIQAEYYHPDFITEIEKLKLEEKGEE
jgi:RNA polymerase sigma factor (sigma-70 family)